jgi:glycosyltransferase involved in cell wall biosynthesis
MSTVDHTFSLIVNTIDRAGPLRALLYGLEQQSYPHFEVIVVVGPTHDNTLEMLTEFGERVRILRCPTANLSQSRNIGLQAARGDIVAYIDDDAVPAYHWLAQLNRLFDNPQLAGTGGKVYRVTPDQSVIQHRIGLASGLAEQNDVRASWLDGIVPEGMGYHWFGRMMGTNMAYRRRDLLEVGGFDEFYQWVYDDTDIALRLTNAGKLVHPVKEAVVYHAPASSRNRQVNTVRGNWWIQTKAAFYFSIKNGPIGGNSRREIALRCLHLWHGHLLWYGQMRRARKITIWQYGKMFSLEARGALSGAYHGWRRNSYSAPTLPQSMTNSSEPIQPFQDANSATQAAVDPINGRRPTITIPDQPLRICLMSMAYPPHQYEGVGRLTNLMARGLFELGHTVHVITRSSQGSAEAVSFYDGAYVHQIPGQRNRYAAYRPYPRLFNLLNYSHAVNDQVRRLMLNDGVQVADTPLWQMDGLVTAVSNTIPTLVRLVTAAKQISDLQQEQNTDARLLGEMERTLIQRAHHVAPNTQATLNNVRKVYNVDLPDGRFTLLPYGIVPAPEEAVQPFPLPAPPPTLRILYVGRLEKRKGILDLFAAIPRILQKVPYARFTIVGGDNSEQDGFQRRKGLTYPQYFQQQHPQLAPYVQFTGAVSDEDLQKHYHSCDLFVAPSLYESFGLIYLEAMNYAKPVIGCRAGGIPEVIDEGVTGLLAEPGDPDSLTEAILTLAQSPTKLYEMGLAGRQQLLSRFSHVQMAERFATVYRQMIAAWRSEQETQNL